MALLVDILGPLKAYWRGHGYAGGVMVMQEGSWLCITWALESLSLHMTATVLLTLAYTNNDQGQG